MWIGCVILSNMGHICKIYKKDGRLFATHSFAKFKSCLVNTRSKILSHSRKQVDLCVSLICTTVWILIEKFYLVANANKEH